MLRYIKRRRNAADQKLIGGLANFKKWQVLLDLTGEFSNQFFSGQSYDGRKCIYSLLRNKNEQHRK